MKLHKKVIAIVAIGLLSAGLFAPMANALPGDLVYDSTIKGQVDFSGRSTSGIAKDSAGNYYVLSYVLGTATGNVRVTKYDADYNLLLQFEGVHGTGDGEFKLTNESNSGPWGIYVDPDDNIWVADSWNHRMQKFDSSGNFLLKIGGPTTGSTPGRFNGAGYGAAFTSDGDMWVTDRGNNRLQKFDLDGNFITQINNAGGAGLSQPNGMTIDTAGNIYAASRNNHRIQKYDADGNYLMTFGAGTAGTADGQLDQPVAVLVDPSNGDVYTYEINNRRISVFSATGVFLRNFSTMTAGFTSHRSFGMIWDNGNITLAVQGTGKIQTITKTGELVGVFNGDGFDAYRITPTVMFGSVDPLIEDGKLFVTDAGGSRITVFDSVLGRYLADMQQASHLYATAITSDTSGDVYILDYYGLQKYGSDGTYIGQVLAASSTGYNHQSGDVVVDNDGNIWITGSGTNNQVRKFSSTGTLLATIGVSGAADGQLSSPTSILLTETELYVVDSGNNRVQVFDNDGNYLRQFGTPGAGNGQFNQPYGIAMDDRGGIYVSDRGNSRIQKFAADGTYLTQFGSHGTGNNEFNIPMGLTFASGKLYVGDAGNGRVQVLSIAPDVPTEPIDLGLNIQKNTVHISWTAPTDDGGSPITQYTIRYRPVGSSTWITVGTTDGTVHSASITGLPAGNYEIQVFASNAAGDGRVAMSSNVTVTVEPTEDSGDIKLVPGAPDTGVATRVVAIGSIFALMVIIVASLGMVYRKVHRR